MVIWMSKRTSGTQWKLFSATLKGGGASHQELASFTCTSSTWNKYIEKGNRPFSGELQMQRGFNKRVWWFCILLIIVAHSSSLCQHFSQACDAWISIFSSQDIASHRFSLRFPGAKRRETFFGSFFGAKRRKNFWTLLLRRGTLKESLGPRFKSQWWVHHLAFWS